MTSNTTLSAKELALKYQRLWQVAATLRTMKSHIATRPVFHKCDGTVHGHVFCSFLALLSRHEPETRIERRGCAFEWAGVEQDPNRLQEVEPQVHGKPYVLRTEAKGTVVQAFHACAVALPVALRPR